MTVSPSPHLRRSPAGLRVTLTCEACETTFEVTPGKARNGRRFCSPACAKPYALQAVQRSRLEKLVPASHATLPTIRASDPRSVLPTHERGCLVGPDDERYVCVTHGVTLAWRLP